MAKEGWTFRTCMHGIREGLDSHDCLQCQKMAVDLGMSFLDGRTYLFESDPRLGRLKPLDLELSVVMSPEEASVVQRILRGHLSALVTVSTEDDSEVDNIPLSDMELDATDDVQTVLALQSVLKKISALFHHS